MNIESILIGLDRLPNEILINNIFPYLHPKSLVWLNKDYYEKYHIYICRITIRIN